MSNISNIDSCFGCGVCAMSCPKKLIKIKLNQDGFYVPYIEDKDACSECGLCDSVCSYQHSSFPVDNKPILSVAAWSKDDEIRLKSSSGGVCFEFQKTLLSEGYNSCVVKYNPQKNRAEHYIAENVSELFQGIGSKYIQSYTFDAFSALKKGSRYIVVGTPCQIDSLRRYLIKMKREDDFVLVDFFCHGVPSLLMWNKYEKSVRGKIGNVCYVAWRNKTKGWHNSYAMTAKVDDSLECSKNDYYSNMSDGDSFFYMFFNNMCLNKPCYTHCKYKYKKSAADIRVGDLWGNTYAKDEKGVSAVVAFTQKGVDLIRRSNIEYVEHPFEVVAEDQQTKRITYRKLIAPHVMDALRDESTTIEDVINIQNKFEKRALLIKRVTHPVDSFFNLLKKFK